MWFFNILILQPNWRGFKGTKSRYKIQPLSFPWSTGHNLLISYHPDLPTLIATLYLIGTYIISTFHGVKSLAMSKLPWHRYIDAIIKRVKLKPLDCLHELISGWDLLLCFLCFVGFDGYKAYYLRGGYGLVGGTINAQTRAVKSEQVRAIIVRFQLHFLNARPNSTTVANKK